MSLSVFDWHSRFSKQAEWTQSVRNYLLKSDDLEHSNQVLEVGCGTGVILSEIIPKTPGHVFGLDIDQENLSMAMRIVPAAHITLGDAHLLPYPPAIFDITFCHFLLLWVSHPEQVVREMARVTKPGGSVISFAEPDYGGRIDYPPALEQLGHWQIESLHLQGADPLIGRKLAQIFNQSDLDNVEVGILGAQWKSHSSKFEIDSEWNVLCNDLEQLNPNGWKDKIDKMRIINSDAWNKAERILYVPTFYARGNVPG